jgi:hypothetical protein
MFVPIANSRLPESWGQLPSLNISAQTEVDAEKLQNHILAALLHDVGRFCKRGNDSQQHHAKVAGDWLVEHGTDDEVVILVREHHHDDSVIQAAEQTLYGKQTIDEGASYTELLRVLFSQIGRKKTDKRQDCYHKLTQPGTCTDSPQQEKTKLTALD